MTMTLEQAFDALNDTTVRLQNVAAECSNDDMADAMREKARVHARAVATVKAHLTQPAQSMDVDMVERACVAHYESWSVFHQWEREAFRRDMKHALTAALQEKAG